MSLGSRLPAGGKNLFQEIKEWEDEAEAQGIKIIRLSTGQPEGPLLLSAREAAAAAVLSSEEAMHAYQDNGSPGVPRFAERFIRAHVDFSDGGPVAHLPTPGTKPILGLVPLACGSVMQDVMVATMPGYPTPAVQCGYIGAPHYELPLNVDNEFRFAPSDIQAGTKLLMLNFPHNPSGQVVTKEWWEALCGYCADNGIRIFNDAAYAALAHVPEACTLAEVATHFPNLSWAEAFSSSKLVGNGTGSRVGAMAGSQDFIGDIATIKGQTDSGFVASMAAGVIAAVENDWERIEEYRKTYASRLEFLISMLRLQGMQLAVEPGAGFFALFKVPENAFGEPVRDAEIFNRMMIRQTGLVGVHFDKLIRYAVCGDVVAMEGDIKEAFGKAKVSY